MKKRGIALVIIFMVFYIAFAIYSDTSKLASNLQRLELSFIPLILISFTASILVKSLRQFVFLKHLNIDINFKQNVIIFFAGLSMLVTPGGMGEIIKSHYLLKNHKQNVSRTIPVVIVERFHDILALFSIILVFSYFSDTAFLNIPIFFIASLLLIFVIAIKNKKLFFIIQKGVNKIKFLKIIEKGSLEFGTTLSSFYKKKILLYGWLLSMLAWFFDALGIFLCFQAFQLDLDFPLITVLGFSSILFGSLSLIPGGVGVTELSFVQFLSNYGLEISTATTVVLFFRLSSIWYTTCIGLVATKFALRKHRPKI